MADVLALLAERGIHLRNPREGANNYTTCPQCSEHRKKKTATCLSVKLDDDGGSVWNCAHCGWADNIPGQGARADHERRQAERQREYQPAARPAQVTGSVARKMVAYFARRGIGKETLALFGVHAGLHWFPQIEAKAPCVVFPYRWRGHVVSHKYRSMKKHFAQDRDTVRSLFNVESLVDNDTAIIVEGEIDVLTLHEAGFESVVSLPDGAPPKPVKRDGETEEQHEERCRLAREEVREDEKRYLPLVNCADDIAHIRKWIIATDGDWPGEALAHQLAQRLGPARCRRVEWPEGCKDANDVLVKRGADALRAVVEGARAFPIAGLVVIRRSQLINYRRSPRREMFEIGIASIDRLVRFRPGQLVVVTGFPADGKSTFVDFVAVQLTQRYGWRWALCSPEHQTEQHAGRLAEIYVNKPFTASAEGGAQVMDDTELGRAEAWLEANYTFIANDAETPLTMDWVLDRARAAWIRDRVRGLVIDPWNEIEHQVGKFADHEYIGQTLRRIRNFGRNHDLLPIVVAHPQKMQRDRQTGKRPAPTPYDISGAAHWFNKPDIILCLHRPDVEKTDVELHVQKVKIKDQGRQGIVGLKWSRNTSRYLPGFGDAAYDQGLDI